MEKEDASLCFRLVFNDAATYDAATKTGGMDGSVVLPEELGRPENKMLEPLVKRLAEAKAEIDGKAGERGPISWADLAVLAAKVSAVKGWRELRVERAGGDQASAVGATQWRVPGSSRVVSVRVATFQVGAYSCVPHHPE